MRVANLLLFGVTASIPLSLTLVAQTLESSDIHIFQERLGVTEAESSQNFDEDRLLNREEARRWTDPWVGDTDLDGKLDHEDEDPLSAAVFYFTDSSLIEEDEYLYTGPGWWIDTFKEGGGWTEKGWESTQKGDQLHIHLNTDSFTNSLHGWIELTGTGDIRLDILGENRIPITEDLYGNLLQYRDQDDSVYFKIPQMLLPPGHCLRLRNQSGAVQVRFARLSLEPAPHQDEPKILTTPSLTRYNRGVGESILASEYEPSLADDEEYYYPNDPRREQRRNQRLQRELLDLRSGAKTVYVNRTIGSDQNDGLYASRLEQRQGPMKTVARSQAVEGVKLLIRIGSDRYPEQLSNRWKAGTVILKPTGHVVLGSRTFEEIKQDLHQKREARYEEKREKEREIAERLASSARNNTK